MTKICAVVDENGVVVNMIVVEDVAFAPGHGLRVVEAAPGAAVGGTYTENAGFMPPPEKD